MRLCVPVFTFNTGDFNGAGTKHFVETIAGNLYAIYVNSINIDLEYSKSTDGGKSWAVPISLHAGTVISVAVTYDRWSNISAGLIHCAYTDNGVDDILYRNIDSENSDNLSAETTVFAGSTAISGGALSITRARGGNLVVAGSIDAGSEDGAWESTDAGATWGSTIADPSEGATQDQYLLLPGWNADPQDVMLIFWDASADELSVKRYDNSADSWAEASIATGMVDLVATSGFPNFAAAVDLANSQNVVVAWTNTDTANADLRCWKITDTTITEVTNVVLNGTDDQGLCAIMIDTVSGVWWVAYGGKSDGSETWGTLVGVYGKASADAGSTWGAETNLAEALGTVLLRSLFGCPRCSTTPKLLIGEINGQILYAAVEGITPHASYQIGLV